MSNSQRVTRIFVLLAMLLGVACSETNQESSNAQAASPWWQNAVIYEIYPRSFADSDADGTGDLNGITQHLDYLQNLGVDAIWLTPFYPSPQVDFGYDVSNYRDVDPRYGTLADFDHMVAEAKRRDIRVLIDLVLNHSSDEHPWFLESSSSRENPKADWYTWHDGKPGQQPPNNWVASFGGSSWEWVPARQQFYYHHYYVQQPDLNWRNPEVRQAAFDILRFWLDRGVAGFRLDGIGNLYEDELLRDEPELGGVNELGDLRLDRIYTRGQPETNLAYNALRQVADEYPDSLLVGQVSTRTPEELAAAYGDNDRLHLPIYAGYGRNAALSAAEFRDKLVMAQTALNGNPPLLVFDSHDWVRTWTRYSDGQHDLAIAKLVATLLLAPRGAALIYYGQEIGMENRDPQTIDEVQDPVGRRGWPERIGRDGERTPMQWNAGRNAGFSAADQTWLPIAPSYTERNVAAQLEDPESLLAYYRELIQLRKDQVALSQGEFGLLDTGDEQILAWTSRAASGETVLVALNFSASNRPLSLAMAGVNAHTLASSFAPTGEMLELATLQLPPYGSLVAEIH